MREPNALTREDADTRVEEGMTVLREQGVSLAGISKRSLDIANFQMCIGGQLAARAKEPVDLFTDVLDCDASKGVICGFDLAHEEVSDENYATLTDAWKAVL